jgi:protein subunit release factor B
MVVKCQATRSRSQNRKSARRLLGEKIEEAEKGPESRNALKAVIKSKKKASKSKKARRKHRALQEEKDHENDDAESTTEPAEEEVKGERV